MCKAFTSLKWFLGFCFNMIPKNHGVVEVIICDEMDLDDTVEVAMDWDILGL